ncbi:hypothetical protein NITLEN_90017 [Nitrospira lenta]|uniref:Uncharacterized protein n=1 Tax=Nitrospira lenta TaxID=1436998 RepID=A0A330L9P6_9BACT|nr:hypothetical protein NITLEN_90017 [Nitrospira lenta]
MGGKRVDELGHGVWAPGRRTDRRPGHSLVRGVDGALLAILTEQLRHLVFHCQFFFLQMLLHDFFLGRQHMTSLQFVQLTVEPVMGFLKRFELTAGLSKLVRESLFSLHATPPGRLVSGN